MQGWDKLIVLGIGAIFLVVGLWIGVISANAANSEIARIERLPLTTAASFDTLPAGTAVLVSGVVSMRNRPVFRNFVAYRREELNQSVDSDGDTDSEWRAAGGATPALLLEAGGLVAIQSDTYRIARGNETWFDPATLSSTNDQIDGTVRVEGLVANGVLTAIGTIAAGAEGNELAAETLFGGSLDELLLSERESVRFQRIFGAIFGFVGLLLLVIGGIAIARQRRRPAL